MVDDINKSKNENKKAARRTQHVDIPYLGPVRKSRRLLGEAPEIIPDNVSFGEPKPYIPPKSEKEVLQEEEGKIVKMHLIS